MPEPFDEIVQEVPSNPFSEVGLVGPQMPEEAADMYRDVDFPIPGYEGLGEVAIPNMPAEDPISVGQIGWGVDGNGSVPANSADGISQDPFADWDQVLPNVDVPIDGIGDL